MNRVLAVAFLAAVPLLAQAPPARFEPARFEVEETTIAQVHAAMQAGQLTCHELVDLYLKRIAAYDKNGPAINAIVLLNPNAEKEADDLDRRYAQSGLAGPLHCVPMIVKDNFETKGLRTTNGALALASYIPAQDAFEVKRVKEA
ncbi:MAG TPA: amidase family protein, partial [Bryobacteraceae bacterium]|nr:amidase family protein [Bryobacteraceae bacterium]